MVETLANTAEQLQHSRHIDLGLLPKILLEAPVQDDGLKRLYYDNTYHIRIIVHIKLRENYYLQ